MAIARVPGSPAPTRLRVAWCAAACVALLLHLESSARAADQPISGRLVKLKSSAGGAQLAFVSEDPAIPFPAIGSADDPASGSPGGIVVEVFTAAEPTDFLSAPAGLGSPGWKASQYGIDSYRYRNSAGVSVSRLRKVALTESGRLRIRADAGLTLAAPPGAVAIRVTTGSLRSCAVFAGASVRRDVAGTFVARGAPAPAVPDCDDATLATAVGVPCGDAAWPECGGACPEGGTCAGESIGGPCRCIFPTQPCGETAPLCHGQCPAGEQCYQMDDFIPGSINACACAPTGEPPCGATGQACNAGNCPAGLACDSIPGFGIYEGQCSCVDPSATCGPGYGSCPPDFECTFFPPGAGGTWSCLPTVCGGTYPTCGGTCADGRACVPLDASSIQLCVCATPSLSCDEGLACGEGLTCPAGEACTLVPNPLGPPSCSCEPF